MSCKFISRNTTKTIIDQPLCKIFIALRRMLGICSKIVTRRHSFSSYENATIVCTDKREAVVACNNANFRSRSADCQLATFRISSAKNESWH